MKEANIQNAIKLVKIEFPSFTVNSSSSLHEQNFNALGMNLKHNVVFSDSQDSFIVKFELSLYNKESSFNANVTMNAFFKANELISDEFKKSPLISVNAPAIAFPFLRSFITTITANAGYDPIFLPSINFMKK